MLYIPFINEMKIKKNWQKFMLISRKIIKTMLYISLNCKIILNCSTQFYKIKKKKTEEIKKTPYK